MFFLSYIRQNLHISVLILCFIFNIRIPIYKHVFFNPKQSLRILYLSIILESLKNTLLRPFTIINILGNNTFVLQNLDGDEVAGPVNGRLLKHFHTYWDHWELKFIVYIISILILYTSLEPNKITEVQFHLKGYNSNRFWRHLVNMFLKPHKESFIPIKS